MAVPSAAAFGRRFRRLSPAERAAFVADLAAAEGHATERRGRTVVVERDGRRRRLAVGARETAAGDRPDVVVAARDRTAAGLRATTDAEVIGPSELRDRLLYAVDRDAGAAICEAHFGRDPAGVAATDGRPPTVAAALGAARRAARPAAAAAALLAAVAGVLALGPAGGVAALAADAGIGPGAEPGTGAADGSGGDGASGAAAGDDGTGGTDGGDGGGLGPPPGVSENGTVDAARLTEAHAVALRGAGSATFRARFAGPRFLTGFDTRRSGYDADDEVRVRIRAREDGRYRATRRTNFTGVQRPGETTTAERFVDADAADGYRRFRRGSETRYDRFSPPDDRDGHDVMTDWTRVLLNRYLTTPESRVEWIRTAGGPRYRIVATGDPVGIDHGTEGYRAVAVVRPDGLVTGLSASYEHPGTGADVRVAFAYRGLSDTAVPPPDWYDAARNGTDGSDDPGVTEPNGQ